MRVIIIVKDPVMEQRLALLLLLGGLHGNTVAGKGGVF